MSFALEIDALSSRNGLMDCWLVGRRERRYHLIVSAVYPPFNHLLALAKAIASNESYQFTMYGEMRSIEFQAMPVAEDLTLTQLYIQQYAGDTIVNDLFDRMEIVHEILEALRGFARDCPRAESEWEFPYFLIEKFENELARGFENPSSAVLVSTANFVFGHYEGEEGVQIPAFNLWLDDQCVMYMPMDDHPHLWWAWLDMLEKILRDPLPAVVIFQRELSEESGSFSSLMGIEVSFAYCISPLPDPGLFQCQITAMIPEPEPEKSYLIVETTLDRRQFVGAFVQAFRAFLEADFVDGFNEGYQFDLRTLPLDRLEI